VTVLLQPVFNFLKTQYR